MLTALVHRYLDWRDDRRAVRRCHMTGHMWEFISYEIATRKATLRCVRCNPDGTGHPEGFRLVTYDEVVT